MGRDISGSLSGLMAEWNVDAPSSWVWNDNQKGAAMDDPKLLTALLQKNNVLPHEDDFLAEDKKVLPVEALSSAYRKFLNANSSFVVQTFGKGGKGKGKGGKFRAQEGKSKARWLPQEPTSFYLMMLPLPDLFNREDGTYLLESSGTDGVKVLVTSENWATLRFNTKSFYESRVLPLLLPRTHSDRPCQQGIFEAGLGHRCKNLSEVHHYWDLERSSRVASLLSSVKEQQDLSGNISGA
jgi:hypothetical protein